MTDQSFTPDLNQFSKAAREWLCESYHVEFRYVAEIIRSDLKIVHASVQFYPWMEKDPKPFTFHIEAGDLAIGQQVLVGSVLPETLRALDDTLTGQIDIAGRKMILPTNGQFHYLKERTVNEWANQLRLTLTAINQPLLEVSPTLDDDLRQAKIPFDGYTDVVNWLGLPDFRNSSVRRSVTVMVNAPAQIAIGECRLSNNELKLAIDVQKSVDIDSVGVAIIGYPLAGVVSRKQVRDIIDWSSEEINGRFRGSGTIKLPNIDTAFVALSIGKTYVQRHWFIDPARSRNTRYVVAQQFDQNLQKVQAKLNANDGRSFEKAVSALLFMSGFAPLLPLEDDGPDVIAVTPGGQVALIECTLKTTDAMTKIGNLVSRREALRRTFEEGGSSIPLMAVLVCQSPRSQITASDEDLAKHDVLLLSKEDLDQHLLSIRNPTEPDVMYSRGRERLDALRAAHTSPILAAQ